MNHNIEHLEDNSLLVHFELGGLGMANKELVSRDFILSCFDSAFRYIYSALLWIPPMADKFCGKIRIVIVLACLSNILTNTD